MLLSKQCYGLGLVVCVLATQGCVTNGRLTGSPSETLLASDYGEARFYASQADAVFIGRVDLLSNFSPAADNLSTQLNVSVVEALSGKATKGSKLCLRTSEGWLSDGRAVDESRGRFTAGSPRSVQMGKLALFYIQRGHYEGQVRRARGVPLQDCTSPFVGAARVNGEEIMPDLVFALPRTVPGLRRVFRGS